MIYHTKSEHTNPYTTEEVLTQIMGYNLFSSVRVSVFTVSVVDHGLEPHQ
jgi:hypothetical protein